MEEKIKKKRGNPNFIKGKKSPSHSASPNPKHTTPNLSMADPTETITEETKTEEAVIDNNGSKTLPDDLFSDTLPADNIKPMDGPTVEKTYGALPNEGESKPAEDGSQTTTSESAASTESAPTVQPAGKPALTPEEKEGQAKQTVELLLQGYEKIHGAGRWFGKIDDDELMSLEQSGKIDLDYELPMGTKGKLTEREFFKQYNSGIEQNITVSEDFKNDVRPPLTRIAIKRGWLVSDEFYVISKLTEDLTTKVSLLIGLKKTCSMVLQACIEIQKKQKSGQVADKKENTETTNNTTTENPNPDKDDWREEAK